MIGRLFRVVTITMLFMATIAAPASAAEELAAGFDEYAMPPDSSRVLGVVDEGKLAQLFTADKSGLLARVDASLFEFAVWDPAPVHMEIYRWPGDVPLDPPLAEGEVDTTPFGGWVDSQATSRILYSDQLVAGERYAIVLHHVGGFYWRLTLDPDHRAGPRMWQPEGSTAWLTPGVWDDRVFAFRVYVHVRTPDEQVDDVVGDVGQAVAALQLDAGLGNALTNKLENAKTSIAAGNAREAANQLGAAINQAEAQTGKKIPAELAAQWIAKLKEIQAALGYAQP